MIVTWFFICFSTLQKKRTQFFLCSNMEKIKNFIDFNNQIHINPWCGDGEEHSPTWCCGRCSPINF